MEETETESKLVKLVGENSTSDFENGELVCGREDAKVTLDLFAGGKRVQETSDGFLERRAYRARQGSAALR